jgi:hypothetical protein
MLTKDFYEKTPLAKKRAALFKDPDEEEAPKKAPAKKK